MWYAYLGIISTVVRKPVLGELTTRLNSNQSTQPQRLAQLSENLNVASIVSIQPKQRTMAQISLHGCAG